ncbi:S8 family serine peptidase [Aquincola tertiaricarbonis]|uniref:S8 family serine peptidase n=1 Tax=Aquincola tertiaricarbonis TaxID=391953 RepID=A0ABY4SEY8_AQUTE|nr:S8 family serine peptidase [Aquincola tertiaricarbonis]URI09764.1 S8 family serine peptidase [Aquincola tertiaricarbonis]
MKKPDAIRKFAQEIARAGGGWITPAYPRTPGHATAFCTAHLTPDYLSAIHAGRAGRMLRRFELQLPVIPQRPSPATSQAPRPPDGQQPSRPQASAELIGVIDSGCPFAHANLRRLGGGTRVLALWSQDDVPVFGANGQCPADFGYGTEVHRDSMDAWMADSVGSLVVNEDICYVRAGLHGLRRRMSHGGAVLDLVAGNRPLHARLPAGDDRPPSWERAADAASKADVVFVDLPRDSVQDSSSGGLGRWLLDGLRYICSCAGPGTQRIVINISNGTSRSTHDGSSLIETAMQDLIQEQKRRGRELHIVVAAGNARDEETHAQLDGLKVGMPVDLQVQVPPACEAPTWITVRVPAGHADHLSLGLTGPRGTDPLQKLKAGEQASLLNGSTHLAAIVFPRPLDDVSSSMALIYIGPTETGGRAPRPSHGVWTMRVQATVDCMPPVDLFISRNQTNPGALVRGRQARFISHYEGYSPDRWRRAAEQDCAPPRSPVRRSTTLNGLATSSASCGLVVVGSRFLRANGVACVSPYSAMGPSAGPYGAPSREDVDHLAPTDMYRGLPGIRVAGNRSGTVVRVNGTSFAAPQVARQLINQPLHITDTPPSPAPPPP